MHFELKNSELTVTVASKGAELRRITDNETQKEYLWNGDSKYWGRVSPVLFPVVGNYFHHESIFNGTTYTLGQHGFARDAEFDLVDQTETSILFRLTSSDQTKQVYPFDFILEIGYELTGREVKVLWTVKNADDQTIYFSIGAHPAFLADLSKASLKFDTDRDLEIEYLDTETGCVGERVESCSLTERILPLTPQLFDDDALILENHQVNAVTLIDENGREAVQVTFDAPVLGIWSPAKKNAPFVCIEPWYGRSDRNGFNQQLTEREYGNALPLGETFHAAYSICCLSAE